MRTVNFYLSDIARIIEDMVHETDVGGWGRSILVFLFVVGWEISLPIP